jgi:Protein of unknown function (DUF3800)
MPVEYVRAYVDETGDRGTKPSSSPYFAFAAVICRDSNRQKLVDELDQLVSDLGKPTSTTLHWAQNIKYHKQRKVATQRLGQLPVRIIYVAVPKTAVAGYLKSSTEGYYNFLAASWSNASHCLLAPEVLARASIYKRRSLSAASKASHIGTSELPSQGSSTGRLRVLGYSAHEND